MPLPTDLANLPVLGSGIGFRNVFWNELFQNKAQVDFLEIIADQFMNAPPESMETLRMISEQFTVIPHAVSLSIGSAQGLDPDYLDEFTDLVNKTNAPWCSEHICFTSAGGVDIGHLAPVPFTWEAIDVICHNYRQVQERIGVPFILENITYNVTFPGSEMTEPQFITEIAERTGCGLLLDITNLFINAANLKYDIDDYLANIPLERVVQLHYVGDFKHGERRIDSHAEPTTEEIFALMDKVIAKAPVKGTILERDSNFPPFDQLLAELKTARDIGRKHGRWA